ncbi:MULTISPECIES: helix-turn-helix domain-containing protein [Rhodococcus]|uniref:Helix-turn-helix domain-containing protein n=1 Tax=Rhodococcus oxybenzonivorans TaxID=1990687 RepID=A0AAE4UV51_9NOCA|nr:MULTISPECIES: helix-turn-helix domain-containing protein [Rhodococcus]MDV7245504.1 helix-turn-helix domain-containing protein [Rhodococcus oxybenzonivorans]MDV7263305.1 helix-turn-helix domain-containing protein [Rhodococcus oxybenzonivorans]MDV7276584.1 helix-turn-helix domain-containing protein [Rhodococcus oxybenzonivorans]MDV7336489.1 helix-turn-helix domain-containing protein [Rhodococcus oxybenzonivorans]MDV7346820.1 helix-turn-helix domain-containing protein [Rhodococcus oxybenzonivo
MTISTKAGTRNLVTVNEAAAYLKCSSRTVRRYIAAGKVPAVRMPGGTALRVDMAALDAILSGA